MAAKEKSSYRCTECSYQTIKWLGCCPECNQWDSFEEQKVRAACPPGSLRKNPQTSFSLTPLSAIKQTATQRMLTGIHEWDRVMGGGIMPSSLIVLTGDPGIGKSTLLLQISYKLSNTYTVYYISTEESLQQLKIRAERLQCLNDSLLFSDTADLSSIITTAEHEKPDVLIIDSIQNCFIPGSSTLPGSIAQLREATFQLMRLAKECGITIILTGHITKEGVIAGPKTLEHMVDAVFYLQGEDRWQTRMLRSVKNRFGTINELGFFEMNHDGLQEVANINEHLIQEASHSSGSALVSIMEGSRPLLLELQALIISSKMNIPQRVISGVDHKQVILIAAILEKYLKIKFSSHDIFFKVSGGFKIKGSSTDLGIALSLLSSFFQQSLPEKSIALAEISLTGQIKPINQIQFALKEAEKFGLQTVFLAKNQKIQHESSAHITAFQHVYELLALFEE